MANLRQIPLTCSGHTRPVVHLDFNRDITECGYFLISACKGEYTKSTGSMTKKKIFVESSDTHTQTSSASKHRSPESIASDPSVFWIFDQFFCWSCQNG